ncbi:putative MFS-type transporter YbfB [Nymphon striatum]|nr:putative MFS-type transporter YbfB [Nymphon striatum]
MLRERPSDMGLEPLGGPDPMDDFVDEQRDTSLLLRREFWYLGVPFFVCGITTTGMIDTHLIPFAHDHGNGDAITSAAVAVLALFNIIGTAGSGLLVDKYDPRRMLGWLYAVRGVSLLVVLVLNEGFWLIQFGILFGLVDFATVAPTQTLVSRYFGPQSLGAGACLAPASRFPTRRSQPARSVTERRSLSDGNPASRRHRRACAVPGVRADHADRPTGRARSVGVHGNDRPHALPQSGSRGSSNVDWALQRPSHAGGEPLERRRCQDHGSNC